MTDFTPGPWRVATSEIREMLCIVTGDPAGAWICGELHNYADMPVAEAEANARLIAAAPDLYAACAEFVRKVECGEARSTASYEQMRAALAKASP